jgi:hypothetical protein
MFALRRHDRLLQGRKAVWTVKMMGVKKRGQVEPRVRERAICKLNSDLVPPWFGYVMNVNVT